MGCKAILIASFACGWMALGCSSASDGDDGNTAGMGSLPPGQTMMPIGMGGAAGMVAPGSPTTMGPGMTGTPGTTPMTTGGSGSTATPMTTAGSGSMMMVDQGTAGAAGSMETGEAGAMGEAGSGETDINARKPPCLTMGNQLALVGDSYIEYINSLTPRLETRATADGDLPSGQHYNNQAVPGSSLAVGLLLIAPQWDAAKRASMNTDFVVMDGGGNDVLLYNQQCLNDGAATDPGCQKVADDASAVAKEIMEDMKATGVSDVLYFFYPHVPAGGQDILDNYAGPKAKQQCEDGSDATFRCHFISLVDAFEGHPEYIDTDGIHPSVAGAEVQADVIWGEMKRLCMGQAPGSECCM